MFRTLIWMSFFLWCFPWSSITPRPCFVDRFRDHISLFPHFFLLFWLYALFHSFSCSRLIFSLSMLILHSDWTFGCCCRTLHLVIMVLPWLFYTRLPDVINTFSYLLQRIICSLLPVLRDDHWQYSHIYYSSHHECRHLLPNQCIFKPHIRSGTYVHHSFGNFYLGSQTFSKYFECLTLEMAIH